MRTNIWEAMVLVTMVIAMTLVFLAPDWIAWRAEVSHASALSSSFGGQHLRSQSTGWMK